MNNNNNTERMNRCRIEWMKHLNPYEYCLIDKMLFQSNLTHANNCEGFKFHVRTLAKETNISTGLISKLLHKWPFIEMSGGIRTLLIQFNYDLFIKWINELCSSHEHIVHTVNNNVHPVNKDCSSREPRSINKEVLNKNNNKSISTIGKILETNNITLNMLPKEKIQQLENELNSLDKKLSEGRISREYRDQQRQQLIKYYSDLDKAGNSQPKDIPKETESLKEFVWD